MTVREFNDTPRQLGDWGSFVAWPISSCLEHRWASRAGIAAFSATLLGWWVSFLFCGVPASQDGELADLTTFQCDVIPLQVSTGQFMRHSWYLTVY